MGCKSDHNNRKTPTPRKGNSKGYWHKDLENKHGIPGRKIHRAQNRR